MKVLTPVSSGDVFDIAVRAIDALPDEFCDWLCLNFHVWEEFVSEADKVMHAGHKHYSTKTILEVLRHHSAISEVGSGWKLNNNATPYLGRLFALVYPQHSDFFRFRETKWESNMPEFSE